MPTVRILIYFIATVCVFCAAAGLQARNVNLFPFGVGLWMLGNLKRE